MFKLFKAQKFQRLHCERLDLFFVLKSFGLIGIKGTMDVNNLLGVVTQPRSDRGWKIMEHVSDLLIATRKSDALTVVFAPPRHHFRYLFTIW